MAADHSVPFVCDVLIVGAGSAGCALAGRLSEDARRRVLIVEAGPDFPPSVGWPRVLTHGTSLEAADYLTLFEGRYTREGPLVFIPRGKVVGGSGALNGGWFLRGIQEDYDSWGSPVWRYEAIEHLFRKMESDLDYPGHPVHGAHGPIPVRRQKYQDWLPHQFAFFEAVTRLGFNVKNDLVDPNGEGIGPIPMNVVDGRRVSAAMAYLDPNRGRSNLSIWGNCTVRRILTDRGRAYGVVAVRDGRVVEIHAGQVVLTAGGLATPHLLVASGIGPAPALAKLGLPVICDLPGVGSNLRDHPSVAVEVAATDRFRPKPTDPSCQLLLLRSCHAGSMTSDSHIVPYFIFEETLRYSAAIQLPASSGALEFLSADPDTGPRIHYRYFESQDDRARLRESVRLIVELLGQRPLRELGEGRIDPSDEDLSSDSKLDSWIERSLSSAFHTCGTCKMGPESDRMAVVDDHGRVHGMANLTVADLSIAPQVPRAPTNATAIMIGERMAELMA